MVVLEPATIVVPAIMVTMSMIVIMVMIMVVPVAVQKLRLDLQNAVEIERVAAEHLVDRNLRALRSV